MILRIQLDVPWKSTGKVKIVSDPGMDGGLNVMESLYQIWVAVLGKEVCKVTLLSKKNKVINLQLTIIMTVQCSCLHSLSVEMVLHVWWWE